MNDQFDVIWLVVGVITEADNEVCSPECSDEGCWGPLDDQCVSCRNFRLGRQCVSQCEALAGVYTSGPRECQHCHPECLNNCSGDVSSLSRLRQVNDAITLEVLSDIFLPIVYPHSAMLARVLAVIVCMSMCVCLSHAGIVLISLRGLNCFLQGFPSSMLHCILGKI